MVFVAYAGPVCPAAATACCAYRPTFIRCLSINPPLLLLLLRESVLCLPTDIHSLFTLLLLLLLR